MCLTVSIALALIVHSHAFSLTSTGDVFHSMSNRYFRSIQRARPIQAKKFTVDGLLPHTQARQRFNMKAAIPRYFEFNGESQFLDMIPDDCAEEKVLRARVLRDGLSQTLSRYEDYDVKLFQSSQMPASLQLECFDLLKRNMEGMYQENIWDWSDSVKRAELEHPLARFLVAIHRPGTSGALPAEVAAFIHYRYEIEDLDPPLSQSYINSSAPAELATEAVLYVYELQALSPNIYSASFSRAVAL
jgi:hypothetical protein